MFKKSLGILLGLCLVASSFVIPEGQAKAKAVEISVDGQKSVPKTSFVASSTKTKKMYVKSKTYVYQKASNSSKKLATYYLNDPVNVVKTYSYYAKIKYKSGYAYVKKSNLQTSVPLKFSDMVLDKSKTKSLYNKIHKPILTNDKLLTKSIYFNQLNAIVEKNFKANKTHGFQADLYKVKHTYIYDKEGHYRTLPVITHAMIHVINFGKSPSTSKMATTYLDDLDGVAINEYVYLKVYRNKKTKDYYLYMVHSFVNYEALS